MANPNPGDGAFALAPPPDTKLWELQLEQPTFDAQALADAVTEELAQKDLDYRSRLLVRRSAEALKETWGRERFETWCNGLSASHRLNSILRESFEESGFPSLATRVVMVTRPETIEQYLRELGTLIPESTKLMIGGSIAAILPGLLHRHTEDIDVPDEVPEAIRQIRPQLDKLSVRYGLHLTHFQSHYLPEGWQRRLRWLNDFGKLSIYLVDPYDLFVGKLFSRREKDRDDLRVLSRTLDREKIRERVREASNLRAEPDLKEAAEANWYILYGEKLGIA